VFSWDISVKLFFLAISGVLLIVFGEYFSFEAKLAKKFIHREMYIPLFLTLFALLTGIIHVSIIKTTFIGKIDIILFIFCMGFLSYGLIRSGFFEFTAYHFTRFARGNTTKLVVLVFILSSILGYLTTNDIVVIAMTPIVFSMAVQSRIKNVKLLLISEFVGANVSAMGQLWGSPTNIIVAVALNISFWKYFLLMLVPTIICTLASLAAIYIILHLAKRKFSLIPAKWQWRYADTYPVKKNSAHASFTKKMLHWVVLFFATFILVVLATNTHHSLFYAIIPAFLVAVITIAGEAPKTAAQELHRAFKGVPYDVFFFSLFYFSLAAELAKTNFVMNTIIPFLEHLFTLHPTFVSITGTVGTSLLVNILNDLPTSAILSEILQHIQSVYSLSQLAFLQSVLIGVNLGACLTPIGALAGMIWLSIIRTEAKRHHSKEMIIPTRIDLVRFSAIKFIPVALITAILSSLSLFVISGYIK
jgi:arsenical pump membrane protein